ncbi:MAG: trypsin-like serine protease, partial [Acidobacteria bacterium]|nr:trypsin-like serine protease [Acidobacteriota bacterium]
MSAEFSRGRNPGKRVMFFMLLLVVLSLGIGIGTLATYRVSAVGPGDSQLKVETASKPLAGSDILGLSRAFEAVAKAAEPWVVNINTDELVRLPRNMPEGDAMGDIFRRFFPDMPQDRPQQFRRHNLGSGAIVDPKGYIITNSHVVSGATKISVNLSNGKEYLARVIAGDELSDIAVIKIEAREAFRYAKIGDSKATKVGDWVVAVGSPFGLQQTVTAGIISATGRVFDPQSAGMAQALLFNDYLQTDAAINPGNSGGPLVNLNGEVIGINSFIQSTRASNAGVGFAVPSHIFVNVYNQILEKGKVMRGWIGVNMNLLPFTPAMAKYF